MGLSDLFFIFVYENYFTQSTSIYWEYRQIPTPDPKLQTLRLSLLAGLKCNRHRDRVRRGACPGAVVVKFTNVGFIRYGVYS